MGKPNGIGLEHQAATEGSSSCSDTGSRQRQRCGWETGDLAAQALGKPRGGAEQQPAVGGSSLCGDIGSRQRCGGEVGDLDM